MNTPTCDACSKPVADQARLCQRCTDMLARDLGDVSALADELVVTRSRQSRDGGDGTGIITHAATKPLPWNEHAAETTAILRSTLVGWTRVVCEERGARPPADHLAAMAAFLLRNLEWIRHHAAAAECADEIEHAIRLARHTIDRRPELAYYGPCRGEHLEADDTGPFCCIAELYARIGTDTARCRECGTEHDVASRQAWLLEQARDQLATVVVLSAALSKLGQTVNESTVRSWVMRGRLAAHGVDHRGRPTFRVGDVMDLTTEQAARPSRRTG
jgi:hypothetical protein